jgi:hypothetical protein
VVNLEQAERWHEEMDKGRTQSGKFKARTHHRLRSVRLSPLKLPISWYAAQAQEETGDLKHFSFFNSFLEVS